MDNFKFILWPQVITSKSFPCQFSSQGDRVKLSQELLERANQFPLI